MGELHNTGEIHASRNTIKMANITHLKYVDDLILAETFDTNRRPQASDSRTGPSQCVQSIPLRANGEGQPYVV